MIPRVFHEGALLLQQEVTLDARASHHLSKVLRLKPDAAITLFNGDGEQYPAHLTSLSPKRCTAMIDSVTPCPTESPLHITLLQGLSRHDRMDTSLQKATELGVNRIIPVICSHSKFKLDQTRVDKKMQHWQQIIISACEQSGRCRIPQLALPVRLDDALDQVDAETRIMFDPDGNSRLSDIPKSISTALFIGPESGLRSAETERIEKQGFVPVRFGSRILRTETAGPAAITAVQVLWGDLD